MAIWNEETLSEFNELLGSDRPTPGGGAAGALVASISSALLMMVTALTDDESGEIDQIEEELALFREEAYELMEEDCLGFREVIRAYRLPDDSSKAAQNKKERIEQALKEASLPPEKLMELSLNILESALDVARKGNKNAWTEVGIAGLFAFAAARSSYYNILINICSIDDEKFNREKVKIAEDMMEKARKLRDELDEYLHQELIDCEQL